MKLKLLEVISYQPNVCSYLFQILKDLKCLYLFLDVIHTVGPQGEKTDLLKNCYKNSLKLMLDNKLRSIAFPCISTGIYGYPNLPAAHVAAYTVRKHLEANAGAVDRVIFCLFMDEDKKIYEGLLQSYFPLN